MFNIITGEKNEEDHKLFTTLTTTVRKFKLDREWVLISDTVGFISKLPAYLIDAFKSTLEELVFTDIVLVVIDAADQEKDLGVEKQKMLFVFNKTESMDENQILKKIQELDLEENKNWISISASTGKNIQKLKMLIKEKFDVMEKLTHNI